VKGAGGYGAFFVVGVPKFGCVLTQLYLYLSHRNFVKTIMDVARSGRKNGFVAHPKTLSRGRIGYDKGSNTCMSFPLR
jgi:hypothetical protein